LWRWHISARLMLNIALTHSLIHSLTCSLAHSHTFAPDPRPSLLPCVEGHHPPRPTHKGPKAFAHAGRWVQARTSLISAVETSYNSLPQPPSPRAPGAPNCRDSKLLVSAVPSVTTTLAVNSRLPPSHRWGATNTVWVPLQHLFFCLLSSRVAFVALGHTLPIVTLAHVPALTTAPSVSST
jgi:hypothetical protein